MPPKILGLCGPIGCGKTALANELAAHHNYHTVNFGEGFRRMLRALFVYQGLPNVTELVDGPLKNSALPSLGGKTSRWARRTLGKEWGRELIWHNLWGHTWSLHLAGTNYTHVVADDVWEDDEAGEIRALGGLIIRVRRPGVEYQMDHESDVESSLIQADHIIFNSGLVSDMLRQLPPGFVDLQRPTSSQPSINAEELGL